jgi:Ca2+-binding RTX toxin-like protein
MRRFLLAVVTAAAALIVVAPHASAATQIGETFEDPGGCSADFTWLQSVSPAGQYSAQSDGVITRWSFEADASPPQLKFKVGRFAGGNSFTIIGESALVTPSASALNTYPIRIPVQAGDVIGLYNATAGDCIRFVSDYDSQFEGGDVVPPNGAEFSTLSDHQLNVSALLEADCDNDGLGDETQDSNLSSCAPSTTPPTGPAGTPVFCRGLPATIVGTEGNDVRVGSRGRDVIAGLGGNDTLSGLAGNDVICGGRGKDTLKGGKGKDTLLRQKGNDTLKGGPGSDKLSGKKGKDKLIGGGGKDKLKGGGGRDVCIGGKANDKASKCEVEKSI